MSSPRGPEACSNSRRYRVGPPQGDQTAAQQAGPSVAFRNLPFLGVCSVMEPGSDGLSEGEKTGWEHGIPRNRESVRDTHHQKETLQSPQSLSFNLKGKHPLPAFCDDTKFHFVEERGEKRTASSGNVLLVLWVNVSVR